MAKVENFVQFNKKDYPDAPEWFRLYAQQLNQTLEEIVTALQSGLTTFNEDAEIFDLQLFDAQQYILVPADVKGEIEEVKYIWSAVPVTSFFWERTGSGVKVTVSFAGSPPDTTRIKIKIKGAE